MENAQNLDVTRVLRSMPRGSRVVVTDVNGEACASRVEVCFPLDGGCLGGLAIFAAWAVLATWGARVLLAERLFTDV